MDKLPTFECNNESVNNAFRYAIACLSSNVITMKSGVLEKEEPCFMAGNHYTTPWTRDAAINVYNAGALLSTSVSKNTLLSVLTNKNDKIVIGDQYWDKIIWVIGAYKLYLANKDIEFLSFAYNVVCNTIEELEFNEFDSNLNLFRGPAVYGDGVSAYPIKYRNKDLSAGILDWVKNNEERFSVGYGIPMFALSTNCVYAKAYMVLSEMAKILGKDSTGHLIKAQKIVDSINKNFWNINKGSYDYLYGESDAQESLGLAFSILFDVANDDKASQVSKNAYATSNGIPCVYPCFKPYDKYGYGRHCGTIWPHIQGFWAKAMLKTKNIVRFENEFFSLTKHAVRDKQFAEIYHPDTGEIYGGIQEWDGKYVEWKSEDYQTWSATAYLNMIFEGIVGLNVGDEITFNPYLPKGIEWVKVKNLTLNNKRYDVDLKRNNIAEHSNGVECKINVK